MYIAPNSNIRLLRNVPLEPDYINTLYFSSVANQTNYFLGMTKYNLLSQSYQRVNKGVCRVNLKAEDLYDCNYMMFQNTSFGTKWFYAFIKSVEYVNNVTSNVYYEIDVMQSWAFDIQLTRCFVEREHSETDEIGDNIVSEPIETGEMVLNHFNVLDKCDSYLENYGVIVLVSDQDDSNPIGTVLDGIFSGARAFLFSTRQGQGEGLDQLRGFLNSFIVKPDAILGIYMVPLACLDILPDDEHEGDEITYHSHAKHRDNFDVMGIDETSRVDGHVVRNMKLLTYPFNYCHVDNANGRELNLRYEFFQDDNGNRTCKPQFHMYGNISMPITVVLRPKGYKGAVSHEQDDEDMLTTESIDLTNFPMCSWNVDSWMAWVAQNSVPETLSSLTQSAHIGLATGAGAVALGLSSSMSGGALAVGAIGIVAGILKDGYKASIRADVCKGSLNNGNVNFASKKHNFFEGRFSVCREMAEIIDDFFDRFGYATNRVKIPNTHSRPQWNYVKTVGSNVGGSIPSDDKKKIDAIFNNGITFWKNPANVDNYSLDNKPVQP